MFTVDVVNQCYWSMKEVKKKTKSGQHKRDKEVRGGDERGVENNEGN